MMRFFVSYKSNLNHTTFLLSLLNGYSEPFKNCRPVYLVTLIDPSLVSRSMYLTFQSTAYKESKAEITVTVSLTNRELVSEKSSVGPLHTSVLLVGDAGNQIVHKTKIRYTFSSNITQKGSSLGNRNVKITAMKPYLEFYFIISDVFL